MAPVLHSTATGSVMISTKKGGSALTVHITFYELSHLFSFLSEGFTEGPLGA